MTQRHLRPCKRPGCPGLTRDRDGFCYQHKQYGQEQKKHQKTQWNRNRKALPFYGSARWQKFRNWYRRNHPLCEDCLEQGLTVPTYCIDHVKEIRDGGELLSEDNSRSLCRKCHAKKTAAEKRKRNGETGVDPAGYISVDGVPVSTGHHWNK